ncbi:hypothetical protein ACFL27_12930 [candidate division CSSED10-310 bacterium]|uniref:Uncharacterized protein n=1 Tax=candidate division CSSED10-310 bacterium TaxID=2855610 RepID=A0ABV6YY13_UNCC1
MTEYIHDSISEYGPMQTLLTRDIPQLMTDVEEVKNALVSLEHDHASFDRKLEEQDINLLLDTIIDIKKDLNIILTDFVSMNPPEKIQLGMLEIEKAFSYLSGLFDDVKEIKAELRKSFIQQEQLQRLKIDWKRLIKKITDIQGFLEICPNDCQNVC